MGFFVAITIGVFQTVTAVLGTYVASRKFSYKQKKPFFWIFIGLAVVGWGLNVWLS